MHTELPRAERPPPERRVKIVASRAESLGIAHAEFFTLEPQSAKEAHRLSGVLPQTQILLELAFDYDRSIFYPDASGKACGVRSPFFGLVKAL